MQFRTCRTFLQPTKLKRNLISAIEISQHNAVLYHFFCDFKQKEQFAKKGGHLSLLTTIKMKQNHVQCIGLCHKPKKNVKAQQILRTFVCNATSTMFQNKN